MDVFWTPYFDPSSRKQEIIQVYSVKQPPENTPKIVKNVPQTLENLLVEGKQVVFGPFLKKG
jgi:hypothetical protein